MIKCICGYDAKDRADLEEHILASMHDDEDHFEARGASIADAVRYTHRKLGGRG